MVVNVDTLPPLKAAAASAGGKEASGGQRQNTNLVQLGTHTPVPVNNEISPYASDNAVLC